MLKYIHRQEKQDKEGKAERRLGDRRIVCKTMGRGADDPSSILVQAVYKYSK